MRALWFAVVGIACISRIVQVWLLAGPRGYDAWGHVSYVLFLDLYRAVPYADQGWSYFHPPLHYLFGWLLAQSGNPYVLARGLPLLASAASLAVAWLAAALVRRTLPQQPLLPLLAFIAVAFLPVHVVVSTMPGNEMLATLLGSAAVALFIANSARAAPRLSLDAGTGGLAGLALLTKFSALIPLLAIEATLCFVLVRGVHPPMRLLARMAVIAGLALAISGPYYARNVEEFGTPFELSRDGPLVSGIESGQPPGERSWRDYLNLPPRLFVDPDLSAEHLIHSVWGSVYLSTWTEDAPGRAWARTLAFAGLIPTVLFVVGLVRSLRRAWRDPSSGVDATLGILALGGLAAFAIFAWRVPIWSALKGSYLLNLSLPYGVFVACAAAELPGGFAAALRRLAAAAVVIAALVAVVSMQLTLLRSNPGENALMAALHAHYGNYDAAREILDAEIDRYSGGALRPGWGAAMIEMRSVVDLQAGNSAAALGGYFRALKVSGSRDSPHLAPASSPLRFNHSAVCAALTGYLEHAQGLLDQALAEAPLAEPLVNRAALRALAGDLTGAEADLRLALELNPALPPAWSNLVWVQTRSGRVQQASRTREIAARFATQAPRGFPYGIGNGFHLNQRRFMLELRGDDIELYRPLRSRGASSASGPVHFRRPAGNAP